MQSLFTRTTVAVLRRNGIAPGAAVASARQTAEALGSQHYSSSDTIRNLGKRLQQQQQQQRGLATERMVYGLKVTDDIKISDPVRRVLSIDNADM